tara:strand:- start:225607 stop:226101 length:495 start_codon:yes stop_codon:yes gene_type:complete
MKNKKMRPENPLWQKYLIQTFRVFIVVLFAFSMLSALHPKLRNYVRHSFKQQFRTVVSTAVADFSDGKSFKVVKIKTNKGLYIEVYDNTNSNISPLVDRIHLPDEKDGFIVFRGQATNLAVDDVDGDNIPDIIAPSFDNNLVAHMNVYSFNPSTGKFEKVSSRF